MAEKSDKKITSKAAIIKPEDDEEKPKGVIYGKSEKKIQPIAVKENSQETQDTKDEAGSNTVTDDSKQPPANNTIDVAPAQNITEPASDKLDKPEGDQKTGKPDAGGEKSSNQGPKFIDKGQYHIKISKTQSRRAKRKGGSVGKKIWLILLLVVLLAGLGFAGYLMFTGDNQDFGSYIEPITDLVK